MRIVRFAAVVALTLASCTKETTVKAPPIVTASPDLDLGIVPSVMLGATAIGSSPIEHFDWVVVSSPQAGQASISSVTDTGDVAKLTTNSLPGLYVVAVTATEKDGDSSAPDFVNVSLTAPSEQLKFEIVCAECITTGQTSLAADNNTTINLTVNILSGKLDGVRWDATLMRDPADTFTDPPAVTVTGEAAQIQLPHASLDAKLTVTATGYRAGQGDVVVSQDITVRAGTSLAIQWHIPGGKPGDKVSVLPGDALYVQIKASDLSGLTNCDLTATQVPVFKKTTGDPCTFTIYPTASGTLELTALAQVGAITQHAPAVDIAIQPFNTSVWGGNLNSVAIDSSGHIVATDGTKAYYLFDASDSTLASTVIPASFDDANAVALSQKSALVGFGASPNFAQYDLVMQKAVADLTWSTPPAKAVMTRVMVPGSWGRVWMAMQQGLALYDPNINGPLQYWDGNGIGASAITWGPNPKPTAADGYMWYAETSTVYCQQSEDLGKWAAGKGNVVGQIQHPYVSALSFGTTKAMDLWVGTAPTGAILTGFGLLLYQDAVDAAGAPQMNSPQEFFAQVEGGIASVAVEQDGPYEGDAWAVAGGKIVRVSRAVADETLGTRGAVALEIETTAFAGKAKAIAVAGRQVAVATQNGLVVVR